jgi:hypothetical protein
MLVWVVPIALAAFANLAGAPGIALILYALALWWLPVLIVAWRRAQRARRGGPDSN